MLEGQLLNNLRVVEIGIGWVVPWAGGLLASLGAEVIKVESITRMDAARGPESATTPLGGGAKPFYPTYPNGELGKKPWNRNSQFNSANFSKYGLTLDLTKPKGLEMFLRLIKVSDVFLTNMAPGVDKKLGIDYEALSQINPKLVYLAASGYGRTGPYSQHVALGNSIDAVSGFFGLRDYGDGDSTSVSPSTHCDSISAVTNVFAILTALFSRKKTGKGMFIDASMVEPSMSHLGEAIIEYTMNNRILHSLGNRDISMSPQGCYPCKGNDEWVTLSISSDEEWKKFTGVIGNKQLSSDERFGDVVGRFKNQDEIDKFIEVWTSQHTKHEVMHMLQSVGISAGAVLNNADVFNDPHINGRNFLETIDHPDAGMHTYAGQPWKLTEIQMPKRSHSPCLGEHNSHVLTQIIGCTPAEVLALEQEGIIGTKPVGK